MLMIKLRKCMTSFARINSQIHDILTWFTSHRGNSLKSRFEKYYRKNSFRGYESISGVGSGDEQTKKIKVEIPKLIKKLKIKTLVDAPCGDNYWIKFVDLSNVEYIGVDIVRVLINFDNKHFASKLKKYVCADLTKYVPQKADMILCRDCLVHLDYNDAKKMIENFKKSGSKYLLITTFTGRSKNSDLGKVIWRTLNFQKAPFNFPKPIYLINEGCTESDNQYTDKCLGLWELKSIQV